MKGRFVSSLNSQPSCRCPLPARLLLLPIRLIGILLLLAISATVRLRRLILSGLLRVVPERHPVAADVRALDALVGGASLAQAHDGASAGRVAALGLSLPQAAFVGFVVGVATAGAAADGEEPEERGDDGQRGCDPRDGERARADADFDVVGVEEGVQGAGQSGEEDCGGEGGEEGEEGGDLVGRVSWWSSSSCWEWDELTIAMIQVQRLPQRLQIANSPTTMVIRVVQKETWYAIKFHFATFL